MQEINLQVVGAFPAPEGQETTLSRELQNPELKSLYKQTHNDFTNLLPKPKPCLDSFLMSINFLCPVKFSQTYCFFV